MKTKILLPKNVFYPRTLKPGYGPVLTFGLLHFLEVIVLCF